VLIIRSFKVFMLIACCAGLALILLFRNGERDTDFVAVNKDYNATMEFGGIERTYRIYVPPSYDETKPAPLLLVFHGLGGDGKEMESATKFNDISGPRAFIVVYPDGYKSSWSDGSGVTPAGRVGIDDVGFVSALIDKLTNELKIDTNRVYATGFSNGGMFVQRLSCEIPDKIAAIASVGGTMVVNISTRCNPERAVSVMHLHGTDDSIVPWEGGEVSGVGISGWRILSVPDTIRKWVDINNCSSSSQENYKLDGGAYAGVELYTKCSDNTEVMLYALAGEKHNWPGVIKRIELPEPSSHKSTRNIYAEEVIWGFFEKHPKK
jgi:polyhydroxybutyrate depolymerase